jgi:ATP-dependent Clp protease ATP-binding subunit ClpC
MASGLKGLLSQAERAARKRSQPVSTVHVLLALCQRTSAGELLSQCGVSEPALLEALASECDEHASLLALVLERAEKSMALLRHEHAHALHVLLALSREPRCAAYRCCERLGARPDRVQAAALALLDAGSGDARSQAGRRAPARAERAVTTASAPRARGIPRSLAAQQHLAVETELKRARDRAQRHTPELSVFENEPKARDASVVEVELLLGTEPASEPHPKRKARAPAGAVVSSEGAAFALDPDRFPMLVSLSRNLCAMAAEGRIDPVLGRDAEIEQVLDVLARRRANNPILVGPPGVGKTAIAEGVALALACGQARGLRGRVLCELSAGALVSGTAVRGALSERLQGLAQEIARAAGQVIVFIDEIHTVVGVEDGADSLASGLKAALARGELPCIGATTEAEYRRIFERDAALARRFTRIDVNEPSPQAALAILRGLAPEYEKHHGVSYEPAALQAAVDMSVRFLHERQLPDKAIGLIDQAAARVRRRDRQRVDLQAIAEVVSERCAVPVERLLMRDGEALLALEAHLERRVVGQGEATAAIAEALRKSAAGLRGSRPLGTFLFLGSTGVGKTEMAKAIAEQVFPGGAMTRLDMSELSEPHALARLIGAPPGYIGYEDSGQLTEAVRGRPYQLVLLDEIEKAHRDVLLALLPLLDEGRLSDSRGRTVDFTNTVVVMTSNLGADAETSRARLGFGDERAEAPSARQRALSLARQALPPELWNRIDEPLYFVALDRVAVARIAERMAAEVTALMLREHGVSITVEPTAIEALIEAGGYDPALGARPMRRTIGRLLEAKLARAILAREFAHGDAVVVRGLGDQILLDRAQPPADAAE